MNYQKIKKQWKLIKLINKNIIWNISSKIEKIKDDINKDIEFNNHSHYIYINNKIEKMNDNFNNNLKLMDNNINERFENINKNSNLKEEEK